MIRPLVKDALGWGFTLWFVGYVLGLALFSLVSTSVIGWVILPIGVTLTMWVLLRRVHGQGMLYFAIVALTWTAIAVAFDYLLIVKAFHPADGYYKTDVYLYYGLTLTLPLAVGWWRASRATGETVAR